MRNLNELAKRVHLANAKWWQDLQTGQRIDRNKGELLSLVVSEISEALEGERKDLMDDKLPHRKMAEVEMADALIRLCDYAGGFGYELGNSIGYNPSVSDNKGEALLAITKRICMIQTSTDPGYCITRVIRHIEAYCDKFQYDLWGATEEKLAYNEHREDHKPENRILAGGKKF